MTSTPEQNQAPPMPTLAEQLLAWIDHSAKQADEIERLRAEVAAERADKERMREALRIARLYIKDEMIAHAVVWHGRPDETSLLQVIDAALSPPEASAGEPFQPISDATPAGAPQFRAGRGEHGDRTDDPIQRGGPVPSLSAPATGEPLNLEIKREWCLAAAKREGDAEVGAGFELFPAPATGEPWPEVTAEQVKRIDETVAPEFQAGSWQTVETDSPTPVVGGTSEAEIEAAMSAYLADDPKKLGHRHRIAAALAAAERVRAEAQAHERG